MRLYMYAIEFNIYFSLLMYPTLTTPLSPKLHDILTNQAGEIFSYYHTFNHHFSIYDPSQLHTNIQSFQSILTKRDLNASIYMAHKANDHCSFLGQAKTSGISIEVASLAELTDVLDHGFTGQDIIAGGIKNTAYLIKAMEVGAIIVVDGVYEIEAIQMLATAPVHLLYRVNHPTITGRSIKTKTTKFGMHPDEIVRAITTCTNPHIIHRGLHLHTDENSVSIRATMIWSVFSLLVSLADHLIDPILDIGGGRGWSMYDETSVSQYLSRLTTQFQAKKSTLTRGEFAFGLSRTKDGTIANLERVRASFPTRQGRDFLDAVLQEEIAGCVLGNVLADSGAQIVFEPGGSLLMGAGMTVLPVIGTKILDSGEETVIVDANIHNISAKMIEYYADPILLSEHGNNSTDGWRGFVTGNLCRPDDVLIRRCVSLSHKPQRGDLLVLPNTAAYIAHFDNAQPHRHSLGEEIAM
ncbi:MAG: hypothetical protein NZL83_02080 [Candidatus Absconditabacterales bacterium]|nr:hypothetical protein [Candidatus Absconditabacterales bacterium]